MKPILIAIVLLTSLFLWSCGSPATPTAGDPIGTMAAELAYEMQSMTAAVPTPTLPPTATVIPTETLTPTPAKDPTKKIITVVNYTGCYHGPGPSYPLQSHINVPKDVELLGIGSVEGWYVISGPYFYSACWVSAADVEVDPDVDLSLFPVMTPGR